MILVFGKFGQVASELQKFSNVISLSSSHVDFLTVKEFHTIIKYFNASAVINAAAYTAVDAAENDRAIAFKVNAIAPKLIAIACNELGIPLLHISTDFVFNGEGSKPWLPGDPTAPLGVYGRSKLSGEKAIIECAEQAIILRTSWVFSSQPNNFVAQVKRLAKTNKLLRVVEDQVGGPTSAASIADTCRKIVTSMKTDKRISGVYHYSGAEDISRSDFAREIISQLKEKNEVINIRSAEYPSVAKRPLNSRLNCSSLELDLKIGRPDWRQDLKNILND